MNHEKQREATRTGTRLETGDPDLIPIRRTAEGFDADDGGAAASAAGPPVQDAIPLVVVGAHLAGMPLNHELTERGATFFTVTRTKPDYRLYALPGTVPATPGLVRAPGFDGPGIAVEVRALTPSAFARFVATISAPLGIGRVALADGTMPQGLLVQGTCAEARDVTTFGGWRAYLASL